MYNPYYFQPNTGSSLTNIIEFLLLIIFVTAISYIIYNIQHW